MPTTSTRLAIPIAALTDSADEHVAANGIVAAIDLIMAADYQGTLAARSGTSPTVQGRYYYATDTGALYRADGTTWQLINPYPATDAAAGVGSLRTLGTSAVQAAAGNDARLSDTRTPSTGSVTTPTIASGAVVFSKMGFATVIGLQKVGYNDTGFTVVSPNLKAGRLLAFTDFTTLLGLTNPRLLITGNGAVSDTSGFGVVITNNGSVTASGSTCSGIDGTAGTAMYFDGSATMYLTVPNAQKQKYGTWGCWMKTPQRRLASPADQVLISMWSPGGTDQSFRLVVDGTTGLLRGEVSTSGASLVGCKSFSTTYVDDDVWHFVAMSWDGAKLCIFVDGVLESSESVTLSSSNVVGQGPANQSASLVLAIGAHSNASNKFEGKMSNVFTTLDALSEVSVRSLYAKKYAHGLGTQPELYVLNVKKYFRSKTYITSDFTSMNNGTGIAQPLMGSNLELGTWSQDFGSLGTTWSGGAIGDTNIPFPFNGQTPAVVNHGAMYFSGASVINGPDTSLPSGSNPVLSYGIWARSSVAPTSGIQILFTYGTAAANAGRALWIDTNGVLNAGQTAAGTAALCQYPGFCDGQWHFVVVVENGGTLATRRLFVDGVLVACGTAATGTVTLGGALGAQIGRDLTATNFFIGSIASFWIGSSALNAQNVRELYSKVDTAHVLADRQPMDPSNCVERADSTNVYWIGDDLEPTDYAELMCA